jgi:hypothetical protein
VKTFPLVLLLLVAASAQAQVYKCPAPGGRTVYSDVPCPGAQRLSDQSLRANSLPPAPAAARPAPSRAPSVDASAEAPQQMQCPSERDVRNLETSASSTTIPVERRKFLQAQARLARACIAGGPAAVAAEREQLAREAGADQALAEAKQRRREQIKAQTDAMQPSYDTLGQCAFGTCQGSNGFTYRQSAGSNGQSWERSDGKRCDRGVGGSLKCW